MNIVWYVLDKNTDLIAEKKLYVGEGQVCLTLKHGWRFG